MEMSKGSRCGEIRLQLPAVKKVEGKTIVMGTPILDVWSQGDDERTALENAHEAVSLFIESCWKNGTLHDVLYECGIVLGRVESELDKSHTDCVNDETEKDAIIVVSLPFVYSGE